MTRKVQSIFFVAFLVVSVFVGFSAIFLPEVQAELNPPHDDGSGNGDTTAGDGIYATDGDWVIETGNILVYSSLSGHDTIIVNGHLVVQPGASLILANVNLQMNCGFNGEFNITVESDGAQGGTLIIQDLDDDPKTNGDASVITSYTPDGSHRFGFMVNGPHGDLKMNNSELHECGWYSTPGIDYKDAGLWIGSSDITIEGNHITDCHNGITIFGGSVSNVVVKNNNISYCEQNGTMVREATNIRISGNEYYEDLEGIHVNTSADVIVENNMVNRNQRSGGIFSGVSNIEVNNNTVMNLQGWALYTWVAFIFNYYSSNVKADNNTIINCPYGGIIAYQYTGLASFTNNTFDDFQRGSGIIVSNGENAFFYRNSIGKNKVATGSDNTNSYWAGPLLGYAHIIECEGYNNEQWSFTNWGAGASLWGVEEVILKNNTFSDNDGSGAYLIDCGNISVKIDGNTIENNYFGMVFSEPSSPPSYGGVKNAIVDSNDINSNSIGISSEAGSNQKFTNNTMDANTIVGIANYVDGSYIADNVITNTGTGDGQYDSGVAILGTTAISEPTLNPIVDDVVLYNNQITDSIGFSTYPVAGILLEDVDNILIEECTLDSNEVGVQSYGDTTNVLLENCTIIDGILSDYSFVLESDSQITTLNTTFDNTTTNVDSTSNLTVKWYLHTRVMNGGVGQNNAEVWVNDSSGSPDPITGQPFTTKNIDGEDGWVKWIPVTEYIESDNILDYHTTHQVNAIYGVMEGFAFPKIWKTDSITIDLNGKPVVIDLTAPPYFLNRSETIYFFANGSDLEDSEDMLTPYFEYRDPNDAGWNTSFLGTPLWDVSGFWKISFTPPVGAPTGWYDIRVRFKDTYGLYSEWFVLIDSVLVENSPPYVTGMSNMTISGDAGPGAIYRGGNVRIYADGDDPEDGDDQNFLDAEFQYKRPGESWGIHTGYWVGPPAKDSGDWYRSFEPANSIDTPTGVYEFRVRFQDSDGNWGPWGEYEQINVINNAPWFVGFNKQAGIVYRGDTVRVYGDVADQEEIEPDLIVHFYYKNVLDVTWSDTWLTANGLFDGFSFYADFSPPSTAELGLYEFKIEITDHESPGVDGDTVSVTPAGTAIEVMNNLPYVDNIKTSKYNVGAGTDSVFVHVNATDFEDIEADMIIERIEWRWNNSATQDPPADVWHTDSSKININLNEGYELGAGGYIKASMSPSASASLGRYDIRVRVEDLDTGLSPWAYLMNAFEVISPEPILEDIIVQYHEVFRGGTKYITVNASDPSEPEENLTVELDYRKVSGGSWTDIIVTPDMYNQTGGYWMIPFSPDVDWIDSELGDYEFRARVKNSVGAYSNGGAFTPAGTTMEVKNNVPVTDDVQSSKYFVELGVDTVYIHINATDMEDIEADLIIESIEWRENNSLNQDPPLNPWLTDSGKIVINLNEGYVLDAGGYIKASMSPTIDAYKGRYDIRVRVQDQYGDISGWLYLMNAFNVTSDIPILEDITVQFHEVLRGDTIYITVNASDSNDSEEELSVELQFRKVGSSTWNDIIVTPVMYEIAEGYWKIPFSPDLDWNDSELGIYEFRARVQNTQGIYSNGGAFVSASLNVEVKNNVPEALSLYAEANSVERGNTIKIYADGSDREKPQENLTAYFEYSSDGGSSWENTYLGNPVYDPIQSRWEIAFTPVIDADLGDYDFRVRFTDGEDYSIYIVENDLVSVGNTAPVVSSLIISKSEAFRQESVVITAIVNDPDSAESTLEYHLEFQGPSGGWVSHDPSVYFGTPIYIGSGKWEITFSAPGNAELGDYSFRVYFTDTDGLDSDIYEIPDALTLLNSPPEIDDVNIPSEGQREEKIEISVDVSDSDTPTEDLIASFEYKSPSGDWISYEASESYFSSEPEFESGQWVIDFTPPKDAEIGAYSFRVKFSDDENETEWTELIDSFNLVNEPPEIKNIFVPSNGHRNISYQIMVSVTDNDSLVDDLEPSFEYKGPTGDWVQYNDQGSYITDGPEYEDGIWIIEFTSPFGAELGYYSFRVKFSDGLNESELSELIDSFLLINDPPVIEGITVPSTGMRLDPIDIFIDISDTESSEEEIEVTIEYKSPSGDWISFDDPGSYFTSDPEYVGGQWRVPFNPPAGSELGNYSFRVKVSDGDNETEWFTLTNTFQLTENPEDPDDDGLKNDVDTDDDGDGVLDTDDPDPLDPSITKKDVEDSITSFLLLFILFLVIIIIVLLITRRRPSQEIPKEEEPPKEMGEPEVDTEGTEEKSDLEHEDLEEDFADRGEEPKNEI
jgi:hypothetical protein